MNAEKLKATLCVEELNKRVFDLKDHYLTTLQQVSVRKMLGFAESNPKQKFDKK